MYYKFPQCKGKDILWSQLKLLYMKNRSQDTPGLALIPKLKYEHVELSSFSKMRVAQVSELMVMLQMYKHMYVVFVCVSMAVEGQKGAKPGKNWYRSDFGINTKRSEFFYTTIYPPESASGKKIYNRL